VEELKTLISALSGKTKYYLIKYEGKKYTFINCADNSREEIGLDNLIKKEDYSLRSVWNKKVEEIAERFSCFKTTDPNEILNSDLLIKQTTTGNNSIVCLWFDTTYANWEEGLFMFPKKTIEEYKQEEEFRGSSIWTSMAANHGIFTQNASQMLFHYGETGSINNVKEYFDKKIDQLKGIKSKTFFNTLQIHKNFIVCVGDYTANKTINGQTQSLLEILSKSLGIKVIKSKKGILCCLKGDFPYVIVLSHQENGELFLLKGKKIKYKEIDFGKTAKYISFYSCSTVDWLIDQSLFDLKNLTINYKISRVYVTNFMKHILHLLLTDDICGLKTLSEYKGVKKLDVENIFLKEEGNL